MTKQEELSYLFGILSEASKWASSSGDPDTVRLEVEERVRNLISGVSPEPDNLPAEEENLTGSEYQAPESVEQPNKWAKQMKWRADKVRCTENGRLVWHLRSECRKVPRDTSKGGSGWKWEWVGPRDKEEQCDAMWAEHEAGNAE